MKYKILLAGKNKTVIDDFFSHLDGNIEPMTSSLRWDDLIGHIEYFQPDAFCYCIAYEEVEHINQMVSFKLQLLKNDIPFVVIGSAEDCTEFEKTALGTADLVLRKPLKAATIEEQLIKYINELRAEEERRLEEERQKEEQKRLEEEQKRLEEEKLRLAEDMLRRRHILVVDDDSNMLKLIKEQLTQDYDVATAINGKIALKFLEKKTTDLILLDYEMPGETGPMVLEKLRENDATKDIPVIFLTGISDRNKIKQVLSMKPQGYLLKPIDHKKLMNTLKKVLMGED